MMPSSEAIGILVVVLVIIIGCVFYAVRSIKKGRIPKNQNLTNSVL